MAEFQHAGQPQAQPDRIISRAELQTTLGRSSQTIRRWIKDGTLPTPDIGLTRKTKGWRLSTLIAAGVRLT
jgi:predicted DNA-binding transcriptional regulator AlpA